MAPWEAMPILAGKTRIEAGVAKVRAVREAIGPEVELMVDAHGRLSPPVAVRAAMALAPLGITFLRSHACLGTRRRSAHCPQVAGAHCGRGAPLHALGLFRAARLAHHRRVAARHHPKRGHCRGATGRRAGGDALRRRGAPQPVELGHRSLCNLDAVVPNFLMQEVITDPEP